MKISELRGLLGQLQLRHGDLEVTGDSGSPINGASFFQVVIYHGTPEARPVGEPSITLSADESPADRASTKHKDDE